MKYTLRILIACGIAIGAVAGQSFYKDPALFSKRPDEKKSAQMIDRFGPVGISIELIQPAFTMRITGIEPGSPASKTGLKPGLIIESINGER